MYTYKIIFEFGNRKSTTVVTDSEMSIDDYSVHICSKPFLTVRSPDMKGTININMQQVIRFTVLDDGGK